MVENSRSQARAEFERDVLLNQVDEKDRKIRDLEDQLRKAVELAAGGLKKEAGALREALDSASQNLKAAVAAQPSKAAATPPPPPAQQTSREPIPVQIQRAIEKAQTLEKQFHEMAAAMTRELNQLKGSYPLRALLSAKDAEIKRVQKIASQLPKQHPERMSFEQVLVAHFEERDHLRLLVEQAEQVIRYQEERLVEVSREISRRASEVGR